jgi:ABC-type multidrug transport system fused ATPase/permease subunit
VTQAQADEPVVVGPPVRVDSQLAQGVQADGVRRTFGSIAVDSIHLEAPPGQVTALIGPTGSGKTTLLLVPHLPPRDHAQNTHPDHYW